MKISYQAGLYVPDVFTFLGETNCNKYFSTVKSEPFWNEADFIYLVVCFNKLMHCK